MAVEKTVDQQIVIVALLRLTRGAHGPEIKPPDDGAQDDHPGAFKRHLHRVAPTERISKPHLHRGYGPLGLAHSRPRNEPPQFRAPSLRHNRLWLDRPQTGRRAGEDPAFALRV